MRLAESQLAAEQCCVTVAQLEANLREAEEAIAAYWAPRRRGSASPAAAGAAGPEASAMNADQARLPCGLTRPLNDLVGTWSRARVAMGFATDCGASAEPSQA